MFSSAVKILEKVKNCIYLLKGKFNFKMAKFNLDETC